MIILHTLIGKIYKLRQTVNIFYISNRFFTRTSFFYNETRQIRKMEPAPQPPKDEENVRHI